MIDAPYERIPLYVRAGAIVPLGDDIQYTDEKPADHIRLYIIRELMESLRYMKMRG